MHNGALRKWALALTFWLALHTSSLRAQILLGPFSNSTGSFEVDANGLLSDTGTFGTGTLSLSGAGTRMFWYPGKAAFRAGSVSSTQWNDANIGSYSVAFGQGTTASGYASVAFGSSTASGFWSAAFGSSNTASGFGSAVFGNNNTATVSGYGSAIFGSDNTASGRNSTVFGLANIASGYGATAFGTGSYASGDYSTTLGAGTIASGAYSTASGEYTTSSAYVSFAVGFSNVGGGSPTTWVATDPLFEVGNGSKTVSGTVFGNPAATGPSDAFVVYKNGSAKFSGPVTVPPGGDIPMYTGN